jgi:hypothetical protein
MREMVRIALRDLHEILLRDILKINSWVRDGSGTVRDGERRDDRGYECYDDELCVTLA